MSTHDRIRSGGLFLAVALALLPATGRAQTIPYSRYRLENGLTVILHEDHRLPLVAVNLWYHVGSKDEPPGRSGFAHLFEHLMFMGTEAVPNGVFDSSMERHGGSNNATTSNDRTNYFESGPRELLELFLFLEADRMATLPGAMTLEKLDVQRGVVLNERSQSYENRPYGAAWLLLPELLYPAGHPYSWPVIGSREDIESATVEDVREFFDAFYRPSNASLVIAGDFDPEEARRLVERHFAGLAERPEPERADFPTPPLSGVTRRTIEDTVALPLVLSIWRSPAVYEPGDAEMDIVANVLGGGKSSRLYRRLVLEDRLAQSVAAYQLSRALASELHVQVFVSPGAELEAVEAAVDEEIARLVAEGITERELERSRNGIEASFWAELEDLAERADLLNRYQFHFDDPGAIGKDLARYASATIESVSTAARRVLSGEQRVVLRVVPRAASGDGEGGER